MSTFETRAPKPRRGVGAAAATRKWRLTKSVQEMRKERLARERRAADEIIKRRLSENANDFKMDPREWGKAVAVSALDQVVTSTRVLDKEKLAHVHLNYTPYAEATSAYTDFKSVTVKTGPNDLPHRDFRDKVPEQVSVLKGIAYHEIGHIKFTVRPWELFDNPSERRTLHRVWNLLEDQRMESKYASVNSRVVALFTVMIANLIIKNKNNIIKNKNNTNSWMFLAGRTYLPDEVLNASYATSPWEEDDREEWYQIVARYKRATTNSLLRTAVWEAMDFLSKHQALPQEGDCEIDEHGMESPGFPGQGDPGDAAGATAEEGATDDEKEEKSDRGKNAGTDSDLDITDQTLHDAVVNAKREALEEIGNRGEVSAITGAVNDSASKAVLAPPPENLQQPMTSEAYATSMVMAEGMKRALSSFMTTTDPHWEIRREVGVLDALAYRTREVGSRDYRRQRIDFDGKGRNVHVSLLCDISGSMSGEPMMALSMALQATASACDELGIGRTLILWSTVYHELWADGPITPTTFNAYGGTNPMPALDTLDDHNTEEADNHLVLVFTDGAWSNVAPLTTWGAPGRKIVVLHYGNYTNGLSMGADEEIRIQNVTDIPELLAQYIGDIMIKEAD